MSISIKSADQIEKMRLAGKLASSVLEMIGEHVRTGVTTEKLDQICHNFIVNDLDSVPAPLNYNGFPKSICTRSEERRVGKECRSRWSPYH